MPTPPEPAQMQTSLRSSQSAITACAPAPRRAAPGRRGPARARTRAAASTTGALAARRSRRSCACSARARRCSERAAASAARGHRRLAGGGLERAHLRGVEAHRVHRVHDDRVDRHVEVTPQSALELDRLVHRHLLRQRDRRAHRSGRGRGGTRRSARRGGPPGPTRAMLAYVLGARSIASPWPVAGRVDDREVVSGPAGARLELGEVPDLADRHQLGEPGRRRGQVLEQPAAAEHAGQRARLQLVAQPLLLGALGVDGRRGAARSCRQPPSMPPSRCCSATSHTHHALAAPRGGQPEGGRDGGLSDAALARHEDEPLVQ